MLGYYIAVGVLVVGVVAWLKTRRRKIVCTPYIKGANLVILTAIESGYTRLYPTADGGIAGRTEESDELHSIEDAMVDWRIFIGRLIIMSMDTRNWPQAKYDKLHLEKDPSEFQTGKIDCGVNIGGTPWNIKQLADEEFVRIAEPTESEQRFFKEKIRILQGIGRTFSCAYENRYTRLYPAADGGIAGRTETSEELQPIEIAKINWAEFTARLRMMVMMNDSNWTFAKLDEMFQKIIDNDPELQSGKIDIELKLDENLYRAKQLPDEEFIRLEPQPRP